MATDFSYDGKQIVSGGPFKPGGKDMPSDARTRVDCYADIATIPNPYVGLKITVKVDETNNNKMTDYIVKSLKANSIGLANSLIDEVVRYVDYLGVNTSGGGTGLTTEQANNIAKIPAIQSTIDALPNNYASKNHNHSEYASKNHNHSEYASSSHRHDASEIDNLPSGGGSGEGLTSTQRQQLQTAYEHSQSSHVQASDLLNIDAVSLNGKKFSGPITKAEYDAIINKDENTIYLVDDDDSSIVGVPDYSASDANKVLAVNSNGTALAWIDAPSGSGSGLTTEQTQQLTAAYNHSQSVHVSSSDINNIINNILGVGDLIG